LFPSVRGAHEMSDLPKDAKDFVSRIERETGVSVTLIGTGPSDEEIIDRRSLKTTLGPKAPIIARRT